MNDNSRHQPIRLWRLGLFFLLMMGITSCAMFKIPKPRTSAKHLPRAVAEKSNGDRISYIYGGNPDGQRIIYVHGSPGDAGAFADYVAEPIADEFAISIDRFGFGETVPRGPMPELYKQAEALTPFLEVKQNRKPILVGHSLGGSIVVQAAIDYRDSFTGIVIISGALDPELEHVMFIQHVANVPPVSWLLPRFISNSNRELMPLKSELKMMEAYLPTIECPIVIIHGTDDGLVPFENVEYMKKHFPETSIREVMVLEGANHFLPWNAEDKVREGIKLLLESTPAE